MLRSRTNRTQFQEDRNELRDIMLQASEDRSIEDSQALREDADTPHTHPHNLRGRTRTSGREIS
jgi:hypothetical protein